MIFYQIQAFFIPYNWQKEEKRVPTIQSSAAPVLARRIMHVNRSSGNLLENPQHLYYIIVPEQFTMQTQKNVVEMHPGKES